jgi:hypothetical protein
VAVIKSGASPAMWLIDETSLAGRVQLFGPNGQPISSTNKLPVDATANLAGDDSDLDAGAGVDLHDVVAIGLPANGGHVVGGTVTNPLVVNDAASVAALASIVAKLIAAPATEGKQDAGNTRLDSLATKLDTVATKLDTVAARSQSQVDALSALTTETGQKLEPADLAALATAARQDTAIARLDSSLVTLAAILTGVNRPLDLAVTAVGAAAAAVTLTLPAAGAGLFHHITRLEVGLYSTAARTGAATPITVTTTNLPGNPAFTFATAAAIGTTDHRQVDFDSPLKAVAANTPTTIVAPAVTGGLWRITASYFAL